jgi:secreted Zn-dependent insulinase-like peptidase
MLKIADNAEVWFKHDDSFDQPKMQLDVLINTIDGNFSQTNSVFCLAEMYVDVLCEQFREESYSAQTAGISSNCNALADYATFSVRSFNT